MLISWPVAQGIELCYKSPIAMQYVFFFREKFWENDQTFNGKSGKCFYPKNVTFYVIFIHFSTAKFQLPNCSTLMWNVFMMKKLHFLCKNSEIFAGKNQTKYNVNYYPGTCQHFKSQDKNNGSRCGKNFLCHTVVFRILRKM